MSRLSEPMDGQIKLKCPRKHELGAILVRPRRPAGQIQTFHRLAAVLKEPKVTVVKRQSDGELELQLPPPETVQCGLQVFASFFIHCVKPVLTLKACSVGAVGRSAPVGWGRGKEDP
jgi:hypothetical protein